MRDVAVGAQFPFGRGDPGKPFADRVVAMPQHAPAPDHQGDPHPERGEDMREFRCHKTTSDDDYVLGQLGDPHDGIAGVILDAGREDSRRNHRPRAGRDHHLIGSEFFTGAGVQQIAPVRLNRPEPGVLVVHVDIGRTAPMVFAADRDWIDPSEDARDDVVPAHPVDVGVDAVARSTPDGVGDPGGVDEHLCRDAPDVQAGATEGALLADRRTFVGVALIENAVPRTGSDDRDVVSLHAFTPSRTVSMRRCYWRRGSDPATGPAADRRPRAAPVATRTRRVWRRSPGQWWCGFRYSPPIWRSG